jgi:hypothetical protein
MDSRIVHILQTFVLACIAYETYYFVKPFFWICNKHYNLSLKQIDDVLTLLL